MPKTPRIRLKLFLVYITLLLTTYLSLPLEIAGKHQTFRILTEEFPPYNYTKNGKITGISTEIIREILRRLKYPDNIEIMSWTDGYNLILNNDNTILFSTTRSPQRADLFKWVGPLVPNNVVFFARKGSGMPVNTLDDAKNIKMIGVYKDDFGEQLLKGKGFTNLDSVIDNKENVQKLVSGEIDLWAINELTGKHLAQQVGLADKIENVFLVNEAEMYIAFSKNTPDSVIRKWQKVLDTMQKDGSYARIFGQWLDSRGEIPFPTQKVIIIVVITLITIGIFIILILNRQLKNKVRLRTEQLELELTKRKEIEKSLIKSEERIRGIFQELSIPIIVSRISDGQVLYSNPSFASTLGYDLDEILNHRTPDFYNNPDDRHKLLEDLKKCGSLSNYELHSKRKDGTTLWVVLSVQQIDFEKDKAMLVGLIDISERKQIEEEMKQVLKQLESTNKELKDFAYIVSHDLKAPLRAIGSLSSWIATDYADKFDDEGKEQLRLLLNRTERMHNLIEGILHYSRVGRGEEDLVEVDLNLLVTEIIDSIAPPENITITIENHLPIIRCEETRISQIFQNLLTNAIKYMDKPKGRITVSSSDNPDYWKFNVADNGPGIDEKYFDKIFQIFQTLKARDEFESTGIGLTVIKKIIEMYNGRIWLKSKVGEGTVFFFTLPKKNP